jgi:acyl-CoA synthetase (AMP-forming)/AMP-acid ligase II
MTLLAARLAARADASSVAIAEPRRTITYGALWDLARRFAGMLAARGIGAGDRVALLLGNSIEAVAATYGSWLAGAAVVPLNVQARARDYGVWLAHAQPRLVVHEAGSAEAHAALATLDGGIERIAIGADEAPASPWSQAVAAQAPIDEAVAVAAGDLAQILYTSGTTGAPKGVMLTHGNLASNVEAIIDYLALDARDSIVSVLPFYYSYGASVLHTHVAAGARLCLEPNLVFPQVVVERLAHERATGFSGVPSTFALLLDRTDLGAFDLSALRYLTQAGGPMAPALTRRLRAARPGARRDGM